MTLAESYDPSQNISINESMVCFKGRSTIKQYLPMKPIKRSFKLWCSSCSSCEYRLEFRFTPAGRPKEIADSLIEFSSSRPSTLQKLQLRGVHG